MSVDNRYRHLSFEKFCDVYKELLAGNGISPHLFRSLHYKLENEVYDAGDYFMLTRDEEEDHLKAVASCEDGIRVSDANAIFLIDHAWTYRIRSARQQLCEIPGLLPRIAEIMGFSVHGEVFNADDDIVNEVMRKLWKYSQTYTINDAPTEEKTPVWYVMDEFGSRVRHSDHPTVAIVPFFYQPTQTPYSLMWLLEDLDCGDEATRDYANWEKDSLLRKCKLLPWQPEDLTHVSTESDRYKFSKETIPDDECGEVAGKTRLKLYMPIYSELLTNVMNFELVEEPAEADVIFTEQRIKDFKKYSQECPNVWLNQFPCEQLLSCKDFFIDIGRRSSSNGTAPPWLPVSFDLQTEFPQFLSYFQHNAASKLDQNCWICKPWSLSRALGIHVSNSLDEIVRLRETNIPMVACKYIEDPVLIRCGDEAPAVKFDIKFVLLVTSFRPLKVHCWEGFTVRCANKGFALNNFDDYEQHFTIMPYGGFNSNFDWMDPDEFIERFQTQHEDTKWEDVVKNIYKCINAFMKSSVARPIPFGVGQYSRSRAIYSADVMLEWKTNEETGL
ncbi:unnamed protein product [Clavelina lepadiformis]|uniref:Tubulin--tyrosine ligase-like protein 12 SET-like domain-containing protein n=1 Tax=Clavelina lepadiformis TaxID=159417 RepID=A0ABP0FUB1_CLALP